MVLVQCALASARGVVVGHGTNRTEDGNGDSESVLEAVLTVVGYEKSVIETRKKTVKGGGESRFERHDELGTTVSFAKMRRRRKGKAKQSSSGALFPRRQPRNHS